MNRIHSIEMHEQEWVPRSIRDAVTDYLAYGERAFKVYDPIAFKLAETLKTVEAEHVVDLCSGGVGPWETLKPQLETLLDSSISVELTDLNPNLDAYRRVHEESDRSISFLDESVDALRTPENLHGFRTMFTAFHHFQPENAKGILADAVQKNEGIALFEMTERTLKSLFLICFSPITLWLFTPKIKPFRWSRIVFTYLIPIVPLMTLWDGWISCLRTYTPEELSEMTKELDEFTWESGAFVEKGMPLPITYLIGIPKQDDQ
jgi:hypothetical protein